MKHSLFKSSYVKGFIVLIIVLLLVIITPNIYLYLSTTKQISKQESIPDQDYECALVFGAGVKNGEPSPILKERLDKGIALYHAGIVPKLLLIDA